MTFHCLQKLGVLSTPERILLHLLLITKFVLISHCLEVIAVVFIKLLPRLRYKLHHLLERHVWLVFHHLHFALFYELKIAVYPFLGLAITWVPRLYWLFINYHLTSRRYCTSTLLLHGNSIWLLFTFFLWRLAFELLNLLLLIQILSICLW